MAQANKQVHCPRLHFRGLGTREAEKGIIGARSRGEGALGELNRVRINTRADSLVRSAQINENQLLGSLPDPSPSQDCSTVYRECAPIRSSRRVRRCHYQGKSPLRP
jgi:hypothetical protein